MSAWRIALRRSPLLLGLLLLPSDGQTQLVAAPPSNSSQQEAHQPADRLFADWDVVWMEHLPTPDLDAAIQVVYALRKGADRWHVEAVTSRSQLMELIKDVNYELLWIQPEQRRIVFLAGQKPVPESSLQSLCTFGPNSDRTAEDRRRYGYTHCNTAFSKCTERASDVANLPLAFFTGRRTCPVVFDVEMAIAAIRNSSLATQYARDQAAIASRRDQALVAQQDRFRQQEGRQEREREERRAAQYRGGGRLSDGTVVTAELAIESLFSQISKGDTSRIAVRVRVHFANDARKPLRIDKVPLASIRTKDGRVFVVVFTALRGIPVWGEDDPLRSAWRNCVVTDGWVIVNPGQDCTFDARAFIPAKLASQDFYSTGSAALAAVSVSGSDLPVVGIQ